MTLISTYFHNDSNARAEVKHLDGMYVIEYYDQSGSMFKREEYKNNSIYFVEDAAENWALGIKKLNG